MATCVNGNSERLIVKAVYKFKASNNDELSFKKADLITVTQKEEGGWWEGTSHETGKTGWFPSNYVKIHSTELVSPQVFTFETNNGNAEGDSNNFNTVTESEGAFEIEVQDKQLVYRQQLVAELIENEKEFVLELRTLLTNYLEPLRKNGDILSESEYRQLSGNLDEIIEVHNRLQISLEEGEKADTSSAPPTRQQTSNNQLRVGRILLSHGALIKSAHTTYWGNHPKAVCIFEKFRDSLDTFMETQGANKPGLMMLTTGLSKPFRHLERYAGLMQEVEQHLSDDHPDRGDTQRSIGFYKNVASECAKIRRQKELELEVLTGSIRGWEGDADIESLGDIIHMGSVAVGPDHKDRYLVLFHQNLLILSVSSRMSAFIYEGKLPLSGIAVNRLEDTEAIRNSFEITGPMIDRILCVCQTKTESLKWVEHLRQQIKSCRQPSSQAANVSATSLLTGHASLVPAGGLGNPPPPPHKSVPLSPGSQKRSITHTQLGNDKGYLWKMSCLRPAPPTRSFLSQPGDTGGNRSSGNKKKDPDTTYEEDMQILRVIEAYCVSSAPKNRQTIANSGIFCQPEHNLSGGVTTKLSLSHTNSPQKIVREDSHCGLLENSCDDLSGDEIDDCDKVGNDTNIEYFDGTNSLMVCKQRKNIFSNDIKRVAEINENSCTYKNWRVSSSIYSEGDEAKSNTLDDDEGCRSSTDMSGKLVGCLPCAPSPSKAAFAVGGAVGGAAKKCAGSLISCKKSNKSTAVSPKKSSMQTTLDSPIDTSFYALSSETEWCCGVLPSNIKQKQKKF